MLHGHRVYGLCAVRTCAYVFEMYGLVELKRTRTRSHTRSCMYLISHNNLTSVVIRTFVWTFYFPLNLVSQMIALFFRFPSPLSFLFHTHIHYVFWYVPLKLRGTYFSSHFNVFFFFCLSFLQISIIIFTTTTTTRTLDDSKECCKSIKMAYMARQVARAICHPRERLTSPVTTHTHSHTRTMSRIIPRIDCVDDERRRRERSRAKRSSNIYSLRLCKCDTFWAWCYVAIWVECVRARSGSTCLMCT